jgi:hypothetical protein
MFFSEENDQARQMSIEDGAELEWQVVAPSANEASQALYDYRGWGEYKPMLRDDGTPYPEDEDDDYLPT